MKLAFVVLTMFGAVQAEAHSHKPSASYFKGQQPIGIAGDVADCFVEATFSKSGLKVKVRSLVADPHGEGEILGLGPVMAVYEPKNLGYAYLAARKKEQVQRLFLSVKDGGNAQALSLVILDGGHLDTLACDNLVAPQGKALAEVEEKFAHFDEHAGGGGHGHDGHKHKH